MLFLNINYKMQDEGHSYACLDFRKAFLENSLIQHLFQLVGT